MGIGYAEARPPVHALLLQRAAPAVSQMASDRVLDVGSGSGLSTRALEGMAAQRVGLEPAHPMARVATGLVKDASFVVGHAERLPFPAQSFDWMTAAGSLNYVELDSFLGEAARVLRKGGAMLVYDFSPGRSMPASRDLDEWFDRFVQRYPWNHGEAKPLDPASLRRLGRGWQVAASEEVRVGVPLTREFYVNYMMTESNVAWALRRGVEAQAIRGWIEDTLPESGWGEIFFEGYWAVMKLR